MSWRIAIVGRPNVGKSTLFNRLAHKQLAIVHDQPGVTRDYRLAEIDHMGMAITLIDTAGWEPPTSRQEDSIMAKMRVQTEAALSQADAIILVVDGRDGLVPADQIFANYLRKMDKPLTLVANKCDHEKIMNNLAEFLRLGLGEALPVAGAHSLGLQDMLAAACIDAKPPEPIENIDSDEDSTEAYEKLPLRMAIVGQPNVGKSTLVNALLNYNRVMVGPEAGLTRDAIATDWEYDGRAIRLVDTAGLRSRRKVHEVLEKMAVGDTLRVIRLAEVVVVMFDATSPFEKQDLVIAQQIIEEGRALLIAFNKIDLIEDQVAYQKKVNQYLERYLTDVRGIPVVYISAIKHGTGVDKLMPAVLRVYGQWNKRISTGKLNRWLHEVTQIHPPPLVGGRPNKLRYITQIKARPPTFALWCGHPKNLPDSYERYLMNTLRESFNLNGVPIRIMRRKGENPYVKD